jgi:HK97 family phage major capsid protein
MNLTELKDKRNKLIHDAQAIVLSENVTAEQRTAVTAMLNDADGLEADIRVVERAAKLDAEQRNSSAPPRGQVSDGAVDNSPDARKAAERKAMTDYVVRGVRSPLVESRVGITSTTGSAGDLGVGGGAIVPQAFDQLLHEAEVAWGDLLTMVRVVKSDSGAPMKVATVNDTSVTWYEETENVADSNTPENPGFNGLLLSTSVVQRPAILVSMAELNDSAFDIDAFMKNTCFKSYSRALSSLIVNGSTSGNIASILGGAVAGNTVTATGTQATITSGTVTEAATINAIGYTDLAAVFAALDPAYEADAAWAFNARVRGALIGVTDALGRPLYIPAPNAGAFDTLLGKRVKLVQALPNLSTGTGSPPVSTYPVIYGDFSEQYTLKLVNPGLVVLRTSERYIDSLSVGFIPFFRAGGINTDAGSHPCIFLKTNN